MLTLFGVSNFAYSQVPFVFKDGDPARASEVNDNFDNLDERIKKINSTIDISLATDDDLENLKIQIESLATEINALKISGTSQSTASNSENTSSSNSLISILDYVDWQYDPIIKLPSFNKIPLYAGWGYGQKAVCELSIIRWESVKFGNHQPYELTMPVENSDEYQSEECRTTNINATNPTSLRSREDFNGRRNVQNFADAGRILFSINGYPATINSYISFAHSMTNKKLDGDDYHEVRLGLNIDLSLSIYIDEETSLSFSYTGLSPWLIDDYRDRLTNNMTNTETTTEVLDRTLDISEKGQWLAPSCVKYESEAFGCGPGKYKEDGSPNFAGYYDATWLPTRKERVTYLEDIMQWINYFYIEDRASSN